MVVLPCRESQAETRAIFQPKTPAKFVSIDSAPDGQREQDVRAARRGREAGERQEAGLGKKRLGGWRNSLLLKLLLADDHADVVGIRTNVQAEISLPPGSPLGPSLKVEVTDTAL